MKKTESEMKEERKQETSGRAAAGADAAQMLQQWRFSSDGLQTQLSLLRVKLNMASRCAFHTVATWLINHEQH